MRRFGLLLLLVPMALSVGILLLVERLDQEPRERVAGGIRWRSE